MSSAAIELLDIEKAYAGGFLHRQRKHALGPISISIPSRQIVGYLGPNGAGKTTTLKILVGLAKADRGEARILGESLSSPSWRHRVGYLPEHPYFYDYLTADEYLDHAGRLFGLPQAERHRRRADLLSQVGLAADSKLPMRRYSKGMVQRLGLAQALINDPELLILDEPMSGLDPLGRRLVRDLILGLKERGKTVFFSTHILPDAEALCDSIALIDRGRLLEHGRLEQILNVDVAHVEALVVGVDGAFTADVQSLVSRSIWLGERVRFEVGEAHVHELLRRVEGAGGRLLELRPIRPSLEEHFLKHVDTEAHA
jgi:ABC-2 type transport system ATP-binding protein